jgi:DMSO/TMAO reductase YedYZ molybdopterin-dependent catalytic subunit
MISLLRHCLAALLLTLGMTAHAAMSDTLTVRGAVEHPLTLSVDDLRAFPGQQLAEVTLTRQNGADARTLQNLKGVRLADLINKAVLVIHDHNDIKKMIVVATATDGYRVVFSWSEIFNSPAGDGMIVYFENNGKPLSDDEGRIAMVSAKDTKTGPRHVKWLQTLEVRLIND